MSQPVIKKACVVGQTADHPDVSSVSRPLLPIDDDLRLISALLLSAPSALAAPTGCAGIAGVAERQRKTAGDMLIRAEYVAEEVARQGGLFLGESAGRALEPGVAALRLFIHSLKGSTLGPASATSTLSPARCATVPTSTANSKGVPQTSTPTPSAPAPAEASANDATIPATIGPPFQASETTNGASGPEAPLVAKEPPPGKPAPPSAASQPAFPAPASATGVGKDPQTPKRAAASSAKTTTASPSTWVNSSPATPSIATPSKKTAAQSIGMAKAGEAAVPPTSSTAGNKADSEAGQAPLPAALGIKSRPMDAFLDSLESDDGLS